MMIDDWGNDVKEKKKEFESDKITMAGRSDRGGARKGNAIDKHESESDD